MTDMEEEQEIVCIVESFPVAEVTWMKNGESLNESSPEIILSKSDKKHSLLLVSVSEESVGEYSCTARNSLGEATATADISGDAHPAEILSNHISDDPHMFTLQWSALSESNIELFEVKIRKEGEEKWKTNEVEVKKENDTTITIDNDGKYHGELLLTDLQPATKYEVTVASKNKFGLNSHGDLFKFKTKNEGKCFTMANLIYNFFSEGSKSAPEQQPSVSTSSSSLLYSYISMSLFSLCLLKLV